MTNRFDFSGLGTALITPFTADGEIDFDALKLLIEYQISGGVDYLVVLGTTAEAATMTNVEKKSVAQFVAQTVKGRLPLAIGIGGNNTAKVKEEIIEFCADKHLSDSYDAILSVCPYYNKPSQEGMYQHFCAIAAASEKSIILYNVPGRTGVNMLPETAIRIHNSHPGKVIAIKEASGNIEQIKRLIALRDSNNLNFLVLSGDDGIAAELIKNGANGLISVSSNYFARDFREIVHNSKNAELLQDRYSKMVSLLFKEGNPAGIKTVLAEKGMIKNRVRLPLVSNSEEVRKEIREELFRLSK